MPTLSRPSLVNIGTIHSFALISSFPFSHLSACSGYADLVVALDTSGSVRPERFPDVKNFVKDIVSNLEIGEDKTHVGVVTWSDDANLEFQLNQYTRKQVRRKTIINVLISSYSYIKRSYILIPSLNALVPVMEDHSFKFPALCQIQNFNLASAIVWKTDLHKYRCSPSSNKN